MRILIIRNNRRFWGYIQDLIAGDCFVAKNGKQFIVASKPYLRYGRKWCVDVI